MPFPGVVCIIVFCICQMHWDGAFAYGQEFCIAFEIRGMDTSPMHIRGREMGIWRIQLFFFETINQSF